MLVITEFPIRLAAFDAMKHLTALHGPVLPGAAMLMLLLAWAPRVRRPPARGWHRHPHSAEGDGPVDIMTAMIYTHVLNRGPAGVIGPADQLLGTIDSAGYQEVDSSARAVAVELEIASSWGTENRLEDDGDGYTADIESEDGFDEC